MTRWLWKWFRPGPSTKNMLALILKEVRAMTTKSEELSASIAELAAAVAALTAADQSAITLIEGMSTRLSDAIASAQNAGATDEQLQDLSALHAALTAQNQALADAVTANTPANVSGATVTVDPNAPAAGA